MDRTGSAISPDAAMIAAYFSVGGRIRRLPYFGYSILLLPLVLVLSTLCLMALSSGHVPALIGLAMTAAVAVFFGWAGWALGIKRCHDFDRSGWFFFWMVWVPGAIGSTVTMHAGSLNFEWGVPVVGGIASLISAIGGLYVLFKRGTDGPNRFGAPS